MAGEQEAAQAAPDCTSLYSAARFAPLCAPTGEASITGISWVITTQKEIRGQLTQLTPSYKHSSFGGKKEQSILHALKRRADCSQQRWSAPLQAPCSQQGHRLVCPSLHPFFHEKLSTFFCRVHKAATHPGKKGGKQGEEERRIGRRRRKGICDSALGKSQRSATTAER